MVESQTVLTSTPAGEGKHSSYDSLAVIESIKIYRNLELKVLASS